MSKTNQKTYTTISGKETILFFRDTEDFNKFLNITEKYKEMYIDGTLYGVGSGFDFSCAGTKFNCLLIRLNTFVKDEDAEYEEDDFYKMESCYVGSLSGNDLKQLPEGVTFLVEKELFDEIVEDSFINLLEIIVIDDNKEKPIIYAEKSPGP